MQLTKQLEKLDRAYVCKSCRAVFLFLSDVDDHERDIGHSEMATWPLRSNDSLPDFV